MSDIERRMLHVTEDEYFEAAQKLNREISDKDGNVERVLTEHIQQCTQQFGRMLHGVAESLVAIDRSTGETDEFAKKVTRRGILTGGVAAVAVAKVAYLPETIKTHNIFEDIEIDGSSSNDIYEEAHENAVVLRDFGWQGMRTVGERTEDLFVDWEERLIPDIRYQSTFRIGGGIVFEAFKMNFEPILQQRLKEQAELEEKDRQAFERQADNVDWDSVINDLLQ